MMNEFPVLRENVWWIDVEQDSALLQTIDLQFKVSMEIALEFLKIRAHCTGHNAITEISKRSKVSEENVVSILEALKDTGIFQEPQQQEVTQTPQTEIKVVDVICASLSLWKDEIISTSLDSTQVKGNLQIGVLLEEWHELNNMSAILQGVSKDSDKNLRKVILSCLDDYVDGRQLVFNELMTFGFSIDEVERSIPLPSTRLIDFLVNELIDLESSSCLIVFSMLAARVSRINDKRAKHVDMFSQYRKLFEINEKIQLDSIVNKSHDLVHALILQASEIVSYYSSINGNYLPRQVVSFNAL